jgi:thermostable 8-oxoguanine DNA glycosylase
MKYLYEIWLSIESKKSKYKACVDKEGSCCIALCASSNKEAIEILKETFLFCDKRPIRNKKKIKDFRLKERCSKYIFLLRKENVESYVRDCGDK